MSTMVCSDALGRNCNYSAGALYSNVFDLYRWDQALMSGRLLSPRSLHDMFTPLVSIPCGMLGSATQQCAYGFGLMIGRAYGHEEISHGGEIPGFLSVNAFFPNDDVVVIAFDNHFSWAVRKVAKSLEAIVFNRPYMLPGSYKAIRLSSSALQRFTGLYQVGAQFRVVALFQARLALLCRERQRALSGAAPRIAKSSLASPL